MSSSDQYVMTLLLANLNNNNYINSTGNTIITNKLTDYAYSTVAPTPTTSGFQNQKEGCVNNYASVANENGSLVDWHNKLSGSSFSPLV